MPVASLLSAGPSPGKHRAGKKCLARLLFLKPVHYPPDSPPQPNNPGANKVAAGICGPG